MLITAFPIVKETITRSMWKFFYAENPNDRIPNLPKDDPRRPEIAARYKAFMTGHEADWYRSDAFKWLFLKSPTEYLGIIACGFYEDGNNVKAGVNLSDRVIECLNAALEQDSKEQHTFPKAAYIKILIEKLHAK